MACTPRRDRTSECSLKKKGLFYSPVFTPTTMAARLGHPHGTPPRRSDDLSPPAAHRPLAHRRLMMIIFLLFLQKQNLTVLPVVWADRFFIKATRFVSSLRFFETNVFCFCVCVCFITAGPITKLFAWGEEESGGHVL
jgi:hypothetical protein